MVPRLLKNDKITTIVQLKYGIPFSPNMLASPQQVLQETDHKLYPPLWNLCELVSSLQSPTYSCRNPVDSGDSAESNFSSTAC